MRVELWGIECTYSVDVGCGFESTCMGWGVGQMDAWSRYPSYAVWRQRSNNQWRKKGDMNGSVVTVRAWMYVLKMCCMFGEGEGERMKVTSWLGKVERYPWIEERRRVTKRGGRIGNSKECREKSANDKKASIPLWRQHHKLMSSMGKLPLDFILLYYCYYFASKKKRQWWTQTKGSTRTKVEWSDWTRKKETSE